MRLSLGCHNLHLIKFAAVGIEANKLDVPHVAVLGDTVRFQKLMACSTAGLKHELLAVRIDRAVRNAGDFDKRIFNLARRGAGMHISRVRSQGLCFTFSVEQHE